jgi:DEAD/DEAH box helicase domain-containing protein
MNLTSLLARWKKDPGIGPNITAWLTIPRREPRWVEFPTDLNKYLQSYLEKQGIKNLYKHQADCWRQVQAGKNLVLATGTASGKSLAYQLPIIDKILKKEGSKALLLFPTKALARDQLAYLNLFPEIASFPYDGDTPKNQRQSIRNQADIIVSNPDMLHFGILPYHTHWSAFFEHLDFIILDEIHIYRGVFGSHVANLLRRLKRITSHYGSKPQYILTSATIGNPLELGSNLIEEDLVLIDQDESSRGEKHFLIYNPPLIDPKLGLRASMQWEIARLADELIDNGLQTIVFGRSRRSVEFMLTRIQERSTLEAGAIQAYRSGYLADQRRELESGLRSGDIRCITATTALELGVDIGGLDASLLAGYPGTIAGTWQQAGRSGRGDEPSLSILALSTNPLDQYLASNPDFLFSSHPEHALINSNNLLIALAHLKCAVYELPFQEGDKYGSFTAQQVIELLSVLQNLNYIHQSGESYFWMSDDYPAAEISLRTTSPNQISLQLIDAEGRSSLLGSIDQESAAWMVHPGAIYLHQGDTFRVEALDLERQNAALVPCQEEYYTEAVKQVTIESLNLLGAERILGANKFKGEIQVTSQVIGYKKINWKRYELIDTLSLDLSPTILNSIGFWISLSEETEEYLRNRGDWNSSTIDYGSNWQAIRQAVLDRDQHTCAACNTKNPDSGLHVHHKMPIRSFTSLKEAHHLSNLISLCPCCHQRAESVVRVKSGLSGLGYLLHNLAPLLLMCDPGDLGLHTDFASPLGAGRPTILLYEYIPAGIGFSQYLFDNISELLQRANSVLHTCSCENGCPACVGPGGELGSGGKQETKAILNVLCDENN